MREHSSWRQVPVYGLVAAACMAVLFCLVGLLRDGLTTDYTWGLLLAPVLLGVAGVAAATLWERLLARLPRVVAALAAVLAALAVAGAAGWWLVDANAPTPLFTGSTFWLLAVAAVCAGLAWVADRALPADRRPAPESSADLDDDAWARSLAGVLRLRKGMPDARVAEIVRDAREDGAAAGQPLAARFGSPESYATRFPRDRVAPPRRRAWLVTGFVALMLATRVPGWAEGRALSGWGVAYVVVGVLIVVLEWRDYRAARRAEATSTER